MKRTKLIGGFLVAVLAALPARAQGTFQNLNFESANLSNPSGIFNEVPIANALPDWSASIGGVPVTEVWANDYSLGTATIDVLGPGWNEVNPGIIDGSYTVYLQALFSGDEQQVNVSIEQNGTIPGNAESLQYSATSPLSVSFAGISLSSVQLSAWETPSGLSYNVYGINIAPYADQTRQLEFTALFPNQVELDDITFSTTGLAPEPRVVAMTAIGGLLFGARKWFGRRG